jgi:hypothetical protein
MVADARKVTTQYGVSWRTDTYAAWVPVGPARRTTQTKRGFVQGTRYELGVWVRDRYYGGSRWITKAVVAVDPVDDWGVPLGADTWYSGSTAE